MSPQPLDVWNAVWGESGAAGRLIVVAILLVALPAMLSAMRQLARFGSERAALARVEANLAHWRVEDRLASAGGAVDAPAPDAASAAVEQPAEVDPLLTGVPPDSMVASRLTALRNLQGQRVRVNLETLQRLTRARDAAAPGTGLPSFAGSMALLLGILGTFVGLAAMVQQIDLGLPGGATQGVDTWTSSLDNLRQVLGGMRTAFSTSLVGMCAAVVCFTLDFWIGRHRSNFHERLERFTVQELLPAVVPELEDKHLLESVSRQLEESFRRLEEVFAANREVLRDLTGAEQAFAAIVDEIRQVTNSDARQDLRQVIGNLEATSRSFLDLSSQLPRIVTAVERGTGRVSRHFETLLKRWFPAGVAIVVLCVWIAMAVTQ